MAKTKYNILNLKTKLFIIIFRAKTIIVQKTISVETFYLRNKEMFFILTTKQTSLCSF